MILHWRIVIEYQVLPIGTKALDRFSVAVGQVVRIGIDRSLTAV